jgi:dihydroxyacetone kinase-like predicted kinase
MRAALDGIAAAEITRASRSATVDGVSVGAGDYLALLDGRAMSAGDDLWVVLDAVLARFSTDGQSYVQVLLGDGAPGADEIAARYADGSTGLEIDVHWGGQPNYPLLLSAE